MDGNAQSFSDLDENYPNPPDQGWVRNVPEASPLTGSWRAPTSLQRPIRAVGALSLRPVESATGYYVRDTAGTIQTDDSTLAISLRPLNSNSSQGALTAPIGTSAQSVGISFNGDSVTLFFNHTQATLAKKFSRGVHATMIMRFTATGINIQYDVNGLRSSESVVAAIAHETASNFVLGYDSKNNAGMYGFVSQVVGVNRAISDAETIGLMTWLTEQPIPDAFAVTKPLVAIVGDSIANGDQVAGWQSWAFSMLADLVDNTNPDVQLLNTATNGAGIPMVKGSDYSDFVLPWYSADRAKNILVVAAGTNDLATGQNLQDTLDRYYGLLDSARATGWKTVACTVLPRSDPALMVGQAAFESARTAFNASVVANYASHSDALANVAAIAGLGAAGDSNNTTYYSLDKIHPIAAGHALMEPVYRAAVASLL
jgi:GDSL-like Lipase/Acylhydrolase family